ncbi:MAG TPA: hypothetical protein PKD58_09500, partial [Candidatus Sumerlaeota bacterium]|nr:hypothetical protein [Candidatus Sumerlaeota bacterium]
MDRLKSIFQSIDSVDVTDILVVSVIFYGIFFLLKESRSFTALRGLVAVIFTGLFVWVIAKVLALTATVRLLENSLIVIVIVFIILFSNELKRALTDFGQTSIFRPFL